MKCTSCRLYAASAGSVLCESCMAAETEYGVSFAADCLKQYNNARRVVRDECRCDGLRASETESTSHHVALRVLDNFIARIHAQGAANDA